MQSFEEGLLCEETGQKQLERRPEHRASVVSGRRGEQVFADGASGQCHSGNKQGTRPRVPCRSSRRSFLGGLARDRRRDSGGRTCVSGSSYVFIAEEEFEGVLT